MSEIGSVDPEQSPDGIESRRGLWIAAGSAALAIVLIVAAVLTGIREPESDPSALPSPSSDTTSTPSPTPSASPTPDVSPMPSEPAPEPTVAPEFGEPVADEVGQNEEGEFAGEISARIVSLAPYTATASQAGEISGSAVLVELELINESGEAVPLDPVTVNAYYGADSTPASPVTSDPGNAPFTGTLASGSSARGSYVFSVPEGAQVTITVSMDATSGLVVFR